jgi:hypothetical protein
MELTGVMLLTLLTFGCGYGSNYSSGTGRSGGASVLGISRQ